MACPAVTSAVYERYCTPWGSRTFTSCSSRVVPGRSSRAWTSLRSATGPSLLSPSTAASNQPSASPFTT
ncbi:hypothetical protein CVO96_12185 [Deinococcus koreensis]|uniref:Uncharacterized protein n=1 Tax=Deinococcus koreensis TaxID=2054903 RepID=A0A2K3UZT1_9DEIO|nr:hypothetical protein CVO96_12185 [Deinococcus koreensis]